MDKYKPAGGSRLTMDQAQTYGGYLNAMSEQHNGKITPQIVVDDAKDPKSPLHDYFEWDEKKAAHQWHITQAQYLIRSIHIVVKSEDGTEDTVRLFHNVTVSSPEDPERAERVYITIKDAMEDEVTREQIIQKALGYLKSWRKRYSQYTELAELFMAIDTFEIAA